VGDGVGDDIKLFASCSPPFFAPVSATELVLGLCISAPMAGAKHAEIQTHERMSALINGRIVFINSSSKGRSFRMSSKCNFTIAANTAVMAMMVPTFQRIKASSSWCPNQTEALG
jgi:hypothetical protein